MVSPIRRTSLLGVSDDDLIGDENELELVDVLRVRNHLVQLGLQSVDALNALLLGVGREAGVDVRDGGASVVLDRFDSVGDLHDESFGSVGSFIIWSVIPANLVGQEGLEPSKSCDQRILSPSRMPNSATGPTHYFFPLQTPP